MRRGALVATVIAVAACTDAPPGVEPPPAIAAVTVVANSVNVLSAIVTAQVQRADSVTVRFRLREGVQDRDSATPPVPALAESVSMPVLGLLPDTDYALWVVAYGPGGVDVSHSLTFTTGALPIDLPHYAAGGPDPSPGYVAFSAGHYGVVIDNTGRVVWYHAFEPPGPGLNFQAQPTGRYVARPPTPDPSDREPWVEIDPLGNVTRTLGCARDLMPRFHDLIAEPDGGYWIMCDETRTMDLTAIGGVANAQVMGTVVQHVSGAGALMFEWSPFDHFALTDLDPASSTGTNVNWTHGNALDLDEDGNLLVSFRSLSEVTKIDTRTGAVVWRMGGLKNEFVFLGTESPAFARQHGLRADGATNIVLLDNLGNAAGSRAERYEIDEAARTVRLVGSYASLPAVVAQLGGTTQTLAGGRTLVAYGNGERVEEYDAAGSVVWRIGGNPGYVFRAQRIASLYRPGIGTTR